MTEPRDPFEDYRLLPDIPILEPVEAEARHPMSAEQWERAYDSGALAEEAEEIDVDLFECK
jgi:hypothetical protein